MAGRSQNPAGRPRHGEEVTNHGEDGLRVLFVTQTSAEVFPNTEWVKDPEPENSRNYI
ncbi:MAG TPA: hypothetical protein VK484_11580 [Ferruginibacter sp.]|nr:hypothetical protein [Ferruginibacter sp.]